MLQRIIILCLFIPLLMILAPAPELVASEAGELTFIQVDGKESTYDLSLGAKYFQRDNGKQDPSVLPEPVEFTLQKKDLRPYHVGRYTEVWMLVNLRFELSQSSQTDFYIDHGYASSEFSVYEYTDGKHNLLYKRDHIKTPEEKAFLPLHSKSFVRFTPKTELTTLIFKFNTRVVSPIVFLRNEPDFHKQVAYDLLATSIFFGGVAILMIFNVAGFIVTRNRENMLYACHLLFLSLANLYILGVSSLIPSQGFVKYFLAIPNTSYICLSFGCISLFVYEFFEIDKLQQKRFRYLKPYTWVTIGFAILSSPHHHMYIAGLFMVPLFAWITTLTIYFNYKGLREAKFFLVSMLPLLFGSTSTLYFLYFDIENINIGMTFYSLGALLEAALVSMAIYSKNDRVLQEKNLRLKLESASKNHILEQTSKIVHRHQLRQIERGSILEDTMPTTTEQACVLSFDIIGSSKIQHIKVKEFFRNVFARCNEAISEGYDGENLKAKAYRIKEMGDGFLCSIGYPFASLSGNPANDAIDLANNFARILSEEAEMLHSPEPICCGIGIAIGTLTGFYPESGTKEYDLYGQGLILATRYEGMRKALFEDQKDKSVLIIQELVYRSLDPAHREGFEKISLKEMGIVVRDDPAASVLYYRFLQASEAKAGGSQSLKAV